MWNGILLILLILLIYSRRVFAATNVFVTFWTSIWIFHSPHCQFTTGLPNELHYGSCIHQLMIIPVHQDTIFPAGIKLAERYLLFNIQIQTVDKGWKQLTKMSAFSRLVYKPTLSYQIRNDLLGHTVLILIWYSLLSRHSLGDTKCKLCYFNTPMAVFIEHSFCIQTYLYHTGCHFLWTALLYAVGVN